jgi:hypothetical protein
MLDDLRERASRNVPSEKSNKRICELLVKLKGSYAVERLFEDVFEDSEVETAIRYCASQIQKSTAPRRSWPHAAEIYLQVRSVNLVTAVLDLALLLDHINPIECESLRRKYGQNSESQSIEWRRAKGKYRLIVDEYRRIIVWDAREVSAELSEVEWAYFWKLTVASRRGTAISASDFSCMTQPKNLTDWKYRLTRRDDFPPELSEKIISRHGRHRLELNSRDICLFPVPAPGVLVYPSRP